MSFFGTLLDRRAASVGAESISQTPSRPLIEALGGSRVRSGVAVTPSEVAGIPTVFACDLVIKRDVAQTPIKIKRRLADGSREDDRDHPVYQLLHGSPTRS